MESSYYFDKVKDLIVVEKSGTATVSEEIDLIRKIMGDPEFHRGMNVISDLSNTTYDWNLQDLDTFRSFVYSIPKNEKASKWALIAGKGVTQATVKIFIQLHDIKTPAIKIRLFGSKFEAIKWLNSAE